MSKLWAFTCIVLALGVGLIAGILVIMIMFVLPGEQVEESKFLTDFNVAKLLQGASPQGTQWDFIDSGSQFRGYSYRGVMGRRWLVEAKLPNANDQATFPTLFTAEIQKAMTSYGGQIYNQGGMTRATPLPTTPGPDGTTPTAPAATSVRYQTTMPYALKKHSGCVHVTVVAEGERVIVSVIVHESVER